MSIAGSDSGGGAGIQADLKTFAALGVHGTCAVTSVTAQNTMGVLEIHDLPAEIVASQIRAVADDMKVAYAKTGMLSSPSIIHAVSETVREYHIPIVTDPVMAAEAGGSLMQKEALRTLVEDLVPYAAVITPNIHEAEALSGIRIHSREDVRDAADRIVNLGANAVIITGGHLDGSDLLYDGNEFTVLEGELIVGGTHGSGCTYSASLAVFLAGGSTLREAAASAKLFVTRSIMESVTVGRGVGPVNPAGYVLKTSHRFEAIEDVSKAVRIIEASDCFADLIPEVGCNIASAVPDAVSTGDVCAVEGRLVRRGNLAKAVGCPAFGASSHMARVVLAAMHYDSSMQAAMNIRYSEEILSVIKGMGLSAASFDRKYEPAGESTMEWGTTYAIETFRNTHGSLPDIIYDLGSRGKEPMIRLLAHRAVDAANRVIAIAELLKKHADSHTSGNPR